MLRYLIWALFAFKVITLVTTTNSSETESPSMANDSQESPPTFVNPKRMQRILVKPAGNTVSFKCRVNGNPAPNITWLKDGKPPSRTLGNLKYGQFHRSLTLEDLVTQDAGKYTCKACNKLGCINFTYDLDVVEKWKPEMLEDVMEYSQSNISEKIAPDTKSLVTDTTLEQSPTV